MLKLIENENGFKRDILSSLENMETESQFTDGNKNYLYIKPISFMKDNELVLVGFSSGDSMILSLTDLDEEQIEHEIVDFLNKNGINDTSEFFFNDCW